MKIRMTWFVVLAVAFAAVGTAWAAKKEIVMTAPEDLKWVDVPNAPGVQVANLTGDIMKGAYSAMVKVPAGQAHPLHTHTAEVKAVVMSGTFSITTEGGVEKKLGPGSYFSIPNGMKHLSGCAAGAPCVFFQQGLGKFDMKPVVVKGAAAPAAAAPAAAVPAPAAAAPPAAVPAPAAPAAPAKPAAKK